MGFNSQSGQLGLGVQSVKGTPVAATRFARLRSGSLGGERSLLIPDPEIGGNRDIAGAYMGPISFMGDLDFYPRMQMMALLLRGVLGSASSSSVAGSNEVQTLTTTGTPTGGDFKLRFRGETTTALTFDESAADVDTALEALGIIPVGGVTVTGGPLPTAIVITFTGAFAATNPPAIEVVEEALTGGTTPTAVVTQTTPGMTAKGTHIITPADTSPWFTVEERIGNQFESYQYVDAKINSLRLEAEATGYLMGSCNIAALTQTSGFTEQTAPPWDQTPMMVGGQITVSFADVNLRAKSFSFEVNNNMETDDFVLGSIFLDDLAEKRREVKVNITRRPQDATLWKAAMYGDSSSTVPLAGPAYQGPVDITMTTFETIGDEIAGDPFSLTLEIPYAVIAPHKITPSGDDIIQSDIEITAVRPDSNVPIVTATVVNDLATVS